MDTPKTVATDKNTKSADKQKLERLAKDLADYLPGHRNNPDPAQFRQAFRQVMVDAILVPSPKANCEEDVDSFLLNLKNFSHAEADASPAVAPVQDSSSELPESMRNILAVMNLAVSNSAVN